MDVTRFARRRRALSRVALWVEALWPAVWPALGVAGVYLAFALFDGPRALPGGVARPLLLGVVGLAVAALLWRGLRRVVWPTSDGADRRLERTSGLRHRPLRTLADTPAAADGDPAALALWRAHQARTAASLSRLRVGAPHPGLPARDRFALRGAVVVLVVAGLVAAGPDVGNRLRAAAVPPPLPVAPVPPPQVEAWATPPAYTGVPPRFLRAGERDVSVPVGSRLVVSVTGGTGAPTVALNGGTLGTEALDAHSFRAEAAVERSGALVVTQDGVPVAAWSLAAVPDAPPVAAWTAPPGPGERDARASVRLPWHVEDDYGVVTLKAELRLAGRPDAPPVVLAVGIPSGTASRNASGTAVQDLVANPWAGLDVQARLVATDAAGQAGRSADAAFALPERTFNHPVARALIAARKALSLQPAGRAEAATTVDRLSDAPDSYDNSAGVTVELGAIASLLRGREKLEDAQGRMWDLALRLEENAADRTAEALERAREAVREAMEAARKEPDAADGKQDEKGAEQKDADARNGDQKEADARQKDATDPDKRTPEQQALDSRLQELRDAIDRHLQALAEQAKREGTDLPYDHTAPHMNQRDMDRMADATRDKANRKEMADAQKQLEQLEKLLDQLKAGRPEHGEEKAEARRQQGRQQMGAVQDMVQREGGLMDGADARTALLPRTQPSDKDARTAEDRRQRALRRALGELMQRFGDLTGEIPPALGEADMAMRDAGDALQSGADGTAAGAELRAIQALQKGSRQMGQQLARQFGPPQSGDGSDPGDDGEGLEADNGGSDGPGGDGQDRTDSRRRDGPGGQRANPRGEYRPQRRAQLDPLGRETRNGVDGRMENGDVRVPEEMERARTRELQAELRRREAEKTRPPSELDYIDRLLKAF